MTTTATSDELRALRAKMGWTQTDLAGKLGVTWRTVARLEAKGVIDGLRGEQVRRFIDETERALEIVGRPAGAA